MSEISQGPGWWLASDGRWYPPAPTAAPAATPGATAAPRVGPAPFAFPGTGPEGTPGSGFRAPDGPMGHRTGPGPIPKHSLKLAGYGSRVMAWLADAVAVFAVSLVLVFGVGIATHGQGTVVALVVLLAFSFWYHAVRVSQNGQTWGMRKFSLRVSERNTGQHPISMGRAFVRAGAATVMGLALVPGLLDLLWPLWDPYNQTLHDKLAGTVVLMHR